MNWDFKIIKIIVVIKKTHSKDTPCTIKKNGSNVRLKFTTPDAGEPVTRNPKQ